MSTPSTHHIEAEQRTRVVAYDIIEIVILESYTVTIATTIHRAYLSRCSTTQAIIDQLIEEGRRIEAQTLVQSILCILVVLQDTLDTMDITIQRLHAIVAIYSNTLEDQLVVFITITHGTETQFLSQRIVRQITVQPQVLGSLRIGLPYLQHSIGQHGLEILLRLIAEAEVPRSIRLLILLIDDTVDRHTSTQDVISHKHIHHVEGVGIVITCTDGDILLVDIVIPCTTVAIPLYALSLQVVKAIDTCSTEHIVGLSKDSPLNHTLLRIIKRITITVIMVSTQIIGLHRAVGIILLLNQQCIRITSSLKSSIEDAQVFLTLHTQLVVSSTVRTRNHSRAYMKHTIDSLDITFHDSRDIIQAGETHELREVGIIIGIIQEHTHTDATASLHRGPCSSSTIEVNLQMLFTREVEARDIFTKRVRHQVHLRHHVKTIPVGIFLNTIMLYLSL